MGQPAVTSLVGVLGALEEAAMLAARGPGVVNAAASQKLVQELAENVLSALA